MDKFRLIVSLFTYQSPKIAKGSNSLSEVLEIKIVYRKDMNDKKKLPKLEIGFDNISTASTQIIF